MSSELELKYVLKTLLSEHGPMKLTNTLNEIYREWYEFFQVVSGQRPEPQPQPKPEEKERKVSFAETIEAATKTEIPTENPIVQTPSRPPVLNVDYALKKQMHLDAIKNKKEALEKEGKNPYDLLAEENLRQWIMDGETYWNIAERTGVPDAEIGQACKKLGIRSAASLKMAQKYAMKKNKSKE